MGNFSTYLKDETSLGTVSSDEMLQELYKRDNTKNPFPLDVFNEKLSPFIQCLCKYYDIPRSFVGLTILSAFSSAIGTAYSVSTNRKDAIALPIWAAIVGMSSSGKSICLFKIYKALMDIQIDFDAEWEDKIKGLSVDKINLQRMDTVIYRDSNIATLIRGVMPDNPKGVTKYSDELIEWINGMNQLSKKEGTDEQFWLSSWNCTAYSGIRSGKQKFVVKKPFVNVIGGIQEKVLFKLFKNDRDTTGFIPRLLFSLTETKKIAEIDPTFEMPEEYQAVMDNILIRLYKHLPVYEPGDSKKCLLLPDAINIYSAWSKDHIKRINALDDDDLKETQASIFGKIKEYTLRFAAILHLSDCALDEKYGSDFHINFKQEEYVNSTTTFKAIRLADYFFESACEVFEKVQTSLYASANVIVAAHMLKRGKKNPEIAEALYGSKDKKHVQRVFRELRKWSKDYPRVFGTTAK